MRTDTGQATGLGLHGNDAQPLPAGGQQKQVHGAQKLRHVRAHAQKAQTVPQAQPVSLVLYLRAKRPVSGQQKHGIRPAPVKFRENIQQKPVVFLLREPAHMADDRGLLRNGQLPAQAETVLRRKGKGLRINGVAQDDHPSGVHGILSIEPRTGQFAAGSQHRGVADDQGAFDPPPQPLQCALRRIGLVAVDDPHRDAAAPGHGHGRSAMIILVAVHHVVVSVGQNAPQGAEISHRVLRPRRDMVDPCAQCFEPGLQASALRAADHKVRLEGQRRQLGIVIFQHDLDAAARLQGGQHL